MNSPPKKIIAMGEVMLELSPQARAGDFALAYAGDTFNTAIHLARLDIPVAYLTELGTDSFSDRMVTFAQSEGLAMETCIRNNGALPGLYLIENDQIGERQFFYWRANSAARNLLSSPEKVDYLCNVVSECDVFYLSGISMAVMAQPDPTGLWQLLDHLRDQQKTIVFDPNYRPALWPDIAIAKAFYQKIAGYCDTVLTTLEDERQLWGIVDVDAVIDFYRSWGVREVVIKLPGASAMAVLSSNRVQCSSVYQGPVVDTSGAGDAFNAGYLAARYTGKSLLSSLAAGHALGAQAVAVKGALAPKPSGVKEQIY